MSETALFIRLLKEEDKAACLKTVASSYCLGENDYRVYEVMPEEFGLVPGSPFAYWAGESVLETFKRLPAFEGEGREAKQGLATAEDFRFVRTSWEILESGLGKKWFGFAKGGAYSPYYSDVHLVVDWQKDGAEIKAGICKRYPYLNGNPDYVAKNTGYYLRAGLTWPRRTNGLSFRLMPAGCIFADKGPAAFVEDDGPGRLLALCAVINSKSFGLLVSVQLAREELAQSFEVGLIQQTPIPNLQYEHYRELTRLARSAWAYKRTMDTVSEISHAFLLPLSLRQRVDHYDPQKIEDELKRIQVEVDKYAFKLYNFSEADQAKVVESDGGSKGHQDISPEDDDGLGGISDTDSQSSLLSWCIGIAFGRFDWRLATGERQPPPEPEPFDPLPAKSPGMLPDGAEPFHVNEGFLVDDLGHPHDLTRLIESVLELVDVPVPPGIRRWLQRDFFKEHLKQYSKSRRKAPIYWPLATASGSYTLWIYYPKLTAQTLYTTVNDFVEPKLKSVTQTVQSLRSRSNRSGVEEKELERAQDFELELTELRDTLLEIAKNYKPNHDDGVQITAAPLWSLFRHKPWQKLLKDTWKKLENGDYDWAHLAMNYWPERVREKCKTDKSLAIAHGLEDVFEGNI